MNNTLIDNSTITLSMRETLKQCFREQDIREVKIATGYWDLPGMALIFDELNDFLKSENTKVQLLIGEDPSIRTYQQLSPAVKNPKFPEDYIKKDINDLELKDEYQKVVNLLLTYCDHSEDEKIEIRIFRQNENEKTQFLHSKCYIFIGKKDAYGIIGSSNFTKKGLEDNAELNYLETNRTLVAGIGFRDDKTHVQWFNEKWEQSRTWNKIFLEEILKLSPIGKKTEKERKNIKPYELYIRFLQNLWGDIVDNKFGSMLEAFLPPGIQKLQYQFDAVNQGYNIMKRHNGFILADVVGLGKTMVGIMVVKRFIEDAYTDDRSRNVLIVTPPAVKKAWMETIALFDRDKDNGVSNYITFITTGSIGQLTEESEDVENIDIEYIEINEKKQFGLILIDESHKFRNSNTQMYQAMDELIGSIYPNPYIVLLSATPQNNSPQDLKNQIFLFQREHQNTTLEKIEGRKLDSFFVEKEKRFQELKKNPFINNSALIELSKEIREKALDDLLVRRTRTDIKKYYENDAEGLKFPEIKGPLALKYKMDNELAQLFAETMDIIAPYDTDKNDFLLLETGLKYYRYRAIEFLLKPEHKDLYQKRNLTTETTSQRLARIMQILLVKRLESSFSAFKTSLHNLQRYTQNMLDMLQDDAVFICPDIDVNAELNTETNNRSKQECYEVIRQKIKKKGENNREFRSADFSQAYSDGLKADKDIIDKLCKRWDKTTFDPKLRKFLKVLDNELFNNELNNPSGFDRQKLVIFTEAIDTVKELKREIEGGSDDDMAHKVLTITAANRNEMQNVIKANFDANAVEKSDEYDIIITTEVLAEGVNLHRSNVIVNYDTPWNSTRLMQRIGRVNRIGSKEKFIHVFNFMPTAEGNAQIRLVQKAHAKLQAFHALFGEDSKIFSDAEEFDSYGKDPDALRNLIDGEESAYEKYIAELKTFKANYPLEYQRIASLPLPLFCAKKSNVDETVCVAKMPEGKGLYLCVANDGVKDISTLEMIEKIQCASDTPSLELPENMEMINKKAIDECNLFFNKMHAAKDSTKIRTAALGVIAKWREQNLSDESKQLLTTADRLVRKGYASLSKKIINLNKLLENNEPALFKSGEHDFNALILNELSALKLHKTDKAKAVPIITLSITNRL